MKRIAAKRLTHGRAPKKIRMTQCTYQPGWIPLGRARTRCPSCGAVLGTAGVGSHPVEMRYPEAKRSTP